MDLRFKNLTPSAEERAAIDVALRSGRTRDRLLPVLHAAQDAVGYISEAALDYICRMMDVPPAEAYGVASFYHLLALSPQPRSVLHVCDDIACRIRGAETQIGQLERSRGKDGTWKRSPCLGQCEQAPAALRIDAGAQPLRVEVDPRAPWDPSRASMMRASQPIPQRGQPGLHLLARCGKVDPSRLDAYREAGGLKGLATAKQLGPKEVIDRVTAAGLQGRGGATFPTGRKWQAVAAEPAQPHYLVCNADESEPGTFKDRVLMEDDPFSVLEGMLIAAFATGCTRAFVYIRGEYGQAARTMQRAIDDLRAAGLLTECEIELRRGAGAYICGEETALFNSIEGKRGEPRSKPPFPVQHGLFGKPTVINNVETLANVPLILLLGVDAYRALGTAQSPGPKLFCLSGHVKRPGLYEAPLGITLADLLALAGGVEGKPRAILLGGAAGSFVGPDQLGTPLSFEGLRAIGASLGSGVVMPFNDTVDLGDIVRRIAQFFRDESCGQCVPCRVGAVRQEEVLGRLHAKKPIGSVAEELALLGEIGRAMRDASICGLGQTASSAVESAVALRLPIFREERT